MQQAQQLQHKDNPLLQKELEDMTASGQTPHEFDLADLVMMQMTGDFNKFLGQLPSQESNDKEAAFKRADETIEETRKGITTEKLFPSIVRKTVTAQFGDKHSALRELGQNAIDSYPVGQIGKEVIFDVANNGEGLTLRARDFGVGMTMNEIVKDLLIPYNSGKQFDVTKIGEHGIGWYSIVDLAEFVKVTSRKIGADMSTQAVVFKDGENWRVALNPCSNDGFFKKLDLHNSGTEVCAFIPPGVTSKKQIKDFLYQHLGMVPQANARIFLGPEQINSARQDYITAVPTYVKIDDQVSPLTMGISKRQAFGNSEDPRFAHRNKNLEKILLTQRGLFIKYDNIPFREDTIHAEIAQDLVSMGMDLWIDVPDDVTLTKGRNNIISSDWPAVLEGAYKGFEHLFLDVVLNDRELLEHPQQRLLTSVAKIFDKNYSNLVQESERGRYSFGRRFASRSAAAASTMVDFTGTFVAAGARKAWKAGRYIGTQLVPDLGAFVKDSYQYFKDHKQEIKQNLKKNLINFGKTAAAGTLAATGLLAAGTGVYLLGDWLWHNHSDLVIASLLATGISAGIVGAGIGTYKVGRAVVSHTGDFVDFMREVASAVPEGMRALSGRLEDWADHPFDALKDVGKSVLNIPGRIYNAGLYAKRIAEYPFKKVFGRFGLYTDVEGKRERKRQKIIAKISNRYRSRFRKDAFLNAIMAKEIVPVEYYFVETPKVVEKKPETTRKSIGEVFSSVFNLNDGGTWNAPKVSNSDLGGSWTARGKMRYTQTGGKQSTLSVRNQKISLDQLITLFITGKIKYDKPGTYYSEKQAMGADEYFVDYKNPVVKIVVDRLEGLRGAVNHTYNVKVLEDRLDNLSNFAKESAIFLYMASGVGIVHLFIHDFFGEDARTDRKTQRGMKNMLENSSVIQAARMLGKATYNGVKEYGPGVLTWSLGLPLTIPYYTAKGLWKLSKFGYDHTVVPLAEAIDPRKYPKYAHNVAEWYRDNKKIRQEKRKRTLEQKRRDKERIEIIRAETAKLEAQQKLERQSQPKPEKKSRLVQFLRGVGEFTKDWYQNSSVRDFFGEGIRGGTGFDDVGIKEIERITHLSGVGTGYISYYQTIRRVDELVSQAIGKKPFSLSFEQGVSSGYYGDDEFEVTNPNKKDKSTKPLNLSLRLSGIHDNSSDAPSSFLRRERQRLNQRNNIAYAEDHITYFDFTLLDKLIHLRTHEALEYYHEGRTYKSPDESHPLAFFEKKDAIRRQVVSYLAQNNIDLTDYINQGLPNDNSPDDVFYLVPGSSLSRLQHMTRRRLIKAAVEYKTARDLPNVNINMDPTVPKEPLQNYTTRSNTSLFH